MPTDKQISNYVGKRIKVYETSRDLYTKLAGEQPNKSSRFGAKAERYDEVAIALSHIKYFIDNNGEEAPEIKAVAKLQKVVVPLTSEEENAKD